MSDGVQDEPSRYDIEHLLEFEKKRVLTPEGQRLLDVVNAGAARFDERPIERASIEARAELREDPRKTALKFGLRQLRPIELRRLLSHLLEGRPVLVDRDAQGRANFDGHAFCPLAIAVGCADMPSCFDADEDVTRLLTESYGFKVYNTRGVAGEFYTVDRRRDLIVAAREVLKEKLP